MVLGIEFRGINKADNSPFSWSLHSGGRGRRLSSKTKRKIEIRR